MAKKFYTGVGSRQTPQQVLAFMDSIAIALAVRGWCLRSGGAPGADTAFEHGCVTGGGPKAIYVPWAGFGGRHDGIAFSTLPRASEAVQIAASVHPAWDRCSEAAQLLHARNVFQVLGSDLASPSKFLLCWTPHGEPVGGTRTAIVLAERHSIPVFNLALGEVRARIWRWLNPEAGSLPPAGVSQ